MPRPLPLNGPKGSSDFMYNYETEKPRLFTDEGQRKFLQIRDRVHELLKFAGAFTMGNAIMETTGSNWEAVACVDRLKELGEIVEINYCAAPIGQLRIFAKP